MLETDILVVIRLYYLQVLSCLQVMQTSSRFLLL